MPTLYSAEWATPANAMTIAVPINLFFMRMLPVLPLIILIPSGVAVDLPVESRCRFIRRRARIMCSPLRSHLSCQ